MNRDSTITPSILLVLALVGCGSDSLSHPSAQEDDAGDPTERDAEPVVANEEEPEEEAEADAGSDPELLGDPNVTIETRDRFGFVSGEITDVVRANPSWERVFVLHGTQTFEGERQPNGSFVVRGVPDGPVTVRMVVREASALPSDPSAISEFPVTLSDGARTVRFGNDHWARDAEELIDEGTRFALSVAAPAGFSSDDEFSWISLSAYLYRSAYYSPEPYDTQLAVPEEDATVSAGWSIETENLEAPYDLAASGLPRVGDDLTVLQRRVSAPHVGPGGADPWWNARLTTTVGMLTTTTATFANGSSNLVSGTLEAPVTVDKTLHVAGDSFGGLREAGFYPTSARAVATLKLLQEAGTEPQLFASVATPFWGLRAVGNTAGGDPGPLHATFALPSLPTNTARDLFELSYAYSYSPSTEVAMRLSGSAYRLFKPELHPDETTGQVMGLALGPVTDLSVGVWWQGDGSVENHTGPVEVRFAAPALGSPDSYEIRVIDLDADFDAPVDYPRPSRVVATFVTRETTLVIPAEVLRDQHTYYVRVTASTEGIDYHQPFVHPKDEYDTTAIFTPPFRYLSE